MLTDNFFVIVFKKNGNVLKWIENQVACLLIRCMLFFMKLAALNWGQVQALSIEPANSSVKARLQQGTLLEFNFESEAKMDDALVEWLLKAEQNDWQLKLKRFKAAVEILFRSELSRIGKYQSPKPELCQATICDGNWLDDDLQLVTAENGEKQWWCKTCRSEKHLHRSPSVFNALGTLQLPMHKGHRTPLGRF